MMTLVWIDDKRDPKDYIDTQRFDVSWMKTYSEFTDYLESHDIPDIIWFDHDLGEEKTGYDCAKYLVEKCCEWDCDLPEYYCQSSNPPGRENIMGVLNSYRKFRKRSSSNL